MPNRPVTQLLSGLAERFGDRFDLVAERLVVERARTSEPASAA